MPASTFPTTSPTWTLRRRTPTAPGSSLSRYDAHSLTAQLYQTTQNPSNTTKWQATEGTTYIDPSFSSHYTGATQAGLIRGGYHFAHPGSGSGASQATYFLAHGGGWSRDGITLPGMVDLEYNPSGSTCYGLSASAMVSWISDFVETYRSKTGVYPLIYTSTSWWNQCTGSSTAFGSKCPLVVARYATSVGTLPAGWSYQTIWQNSDKAPWGGDNDIFNGNLDQLKRIANAS